MDSYQPAAGRASGSHPAAYRKPGARLSPARAYDLPFELAAVRHLVDPALLEAAARRASAIGVGGDEVLRACGVLSADIIAKAIAQRLGIDFDPLDDDLPAGGPITEALKTGVLRRRYADGSGAITIAPRGLKLRDLAIVIRQNPELRKRLRLTSPERMAAYVRRLGAEALAEQAAEGLRDWRPDLSAAAHGKHGLRKAALLCASFATLCGYFFPHESLATVETILGGAFLAWITLRLHACQIPRAKTIALDTQDRSLPYYTIVVALYREARVVPPLIEALRQIDYPPTKLDIKLVCEPDDTATIEALKALPLEPHFEIFIAPDAGPRTKPKALSAVLPFARGDYLVIYDAEDVPEPNQLRVALAAYRRGPRNLACVQARLAIDNVGDNWLTRQFAAEYAGLFDVFLPALADLRLPLPLGGTSNHFRTDVLRAVGGWDPYNVTEDADLGMRLARFGYLSGVIDSTTYEEAPARLGAWLSQRTRWFKGWLQTWLVHMRYPMTTLRELGLSSFLTFQLLVGGTVLAALVHPFFLALVLTDATLGNLFAESETIGQALRQGLAVTTLFSGYAGSAVLAFVGLRRRKLLSSSWVLLLMPLYWILLSFAAWRSAIQLVTAPHLWEKTEHGLARTSRYGKIRRRRPALSPSARRFRAGAADRPPPRRRFGKD
ncbi:MAG TPA: glycosyltransferase family 2 protein [Xanthobacteraceae bacterium]|nr:glycosyltransferase family 2 protein [Xanthobacteraceae bacterium]